MKERSKHSRNVKLGTKCYIEKTLFASPISNLSRAPFKCWLLTTHYRISLAYLISIISVCLFVLGSNSSLLGREKHKDR